MTTKQVIQAEIDILPETKYAEVLDFLNSLIKGQMNNDAHQENQEWSQFSLEQAIIGLEDESSPEYTQQDLKIQRD